MSTTTIKPNGGTPFDQLVNRPVRHVPVVVAKPRPRPRAVRRPAVPAVAPDRTIEQRLTALQKANRVRSRRSQLKRDLKAGRVLLVDVLAAPPSWAETMKAFDLLIAAPKFGRVKVNKVLKSCRMSPSKTLGGMSERQRGELVALLGGRR